MMPDEAAERRGQRVPVWVGLPVILAVIAVTTWLVWNKATAVPKPYERTGADFVVRWTCDKGHSFDANGAPGSKPCPTCGGPAYATFGCGCTNGACGYGAQMQLRYDAKCEPEAMRWRPTGDWQPYIFPPKCPKCGQAMRPG
jgi:hypothetical protein